MSKIQELLEANMKEYMKSKQKVELSATRMALSALKNEFIKLRKELTEDDEIRILKKEVKAYNESLEFAIKSNNIELQDEINKSICVISKYLPKEIEYSEAKAIIEKLLTDNNVASIKEKGKAMKLIMPVLKGKIDGQVINKIVTEILN